MALRIVRFASGRIMPLKSDPGCWCESMTLELHALPCPQRYRWHLEKNATQMAAVSWWLTLGACGPQIRKVQASCASVSIQLSIIVLRTTMVFEKRSSQSLLRQ